MAGRFSHRFTWFADMGHRPVLRLVVATVALWPLLGIYAIINYWQPFTPRVVVMPPWVPFWPAFALPYLAMLLATWFLPVLIRSPAVFLTCLVTMICAHLLVMPWWVLTPTTLPRPPLPSEWWASIYRGMIACDPPNNVMPCAHGIGPLIASWFVVRERPAWRWPLSAFLVIGLSSVALVWQHRPFDIVLGMVAALISLFAGEKMLQKFQLSIRQNLDGRIVEDWDS